MYALGKQQFASGAKAHAGAERRAVAIGQRVGH